MPGLEYVKPVNRRFSCWLHFDSRDARDMAELIIDLARSGCVAFFITGAEAVAIHNQIDDILESIQLRHIYTAWQDEVDCQVAWDFLNLDFDEPRLELRVVGCICATIEDSLAAIERISSCMRAAFGATGDR